MVSVEFSDQEWLRYTRHIQLSQFGVEGQKKLKRSHVAIIGCGGLGCPSALYMAAAGLGRITLIDSDCVDLTNLQRQVAFTQAHIGQSKSQSLKRQLQGLNSNIDICAIEDDLSLDNAQTILSGVDIVLDCTDNFATRYLINDVCFDLRIPWVMSSIAQFSGQCALFTPNSACFRCVFPDSPQGVQNCSEGGVLGVLPGMLAMYQSNEALKYLVDLPTPLENTLLLIDALEITQRKITLRKNTQCACCGNESRDDSQKDRNKRLSGFYARACSADTLSGLELSPELFNQALTDKNTFLIDVRTLEERKGFHIGGEHILFDQLNIETLDSNLTYLVYCQSGVRGLKAAKALKMAQLKVNNLSGGLLAWLRWKMLL